MQKTTMTKLNNNFKIQSKENNNGKLQYLDLFERESNCKMSIIVSVMCYYKDFIVKNLSVSTQVKARK